MTASLLGRVGGKGCRDGKLWPAPIVHRSNEDPFALVMVMTRAPPGGSSDCLSESFSCGAAMAVPVGVVLFRSISGLVPMPWIRLA